MFAGIDDVLTSCLFQFFREGRSKAIVNGTNLLTDMVCAF